MTPPGQPGATAADLDTTRPNIARAYDYLLGGKDNFAAGRDLAEKILAIYPGTRQMVRENRRFLVRALDYVLAQAISQYVDLGAGLPTSPAVHDIVRRYDNTAPVLHVDNDPVVLSHLRALACSIDPHVQAIGADVAGPAAVLAQVHGTREVDLEEPACLILGMVLHFYDAATARDVVAAYIRELAPGSHVIITVGAGDPAIGEQITRTYDAARLYNHSRHDVAGSSPACTWSTPGSPTLAPGSRAGSPPPRSTTRGGQVLAGVGVKK